MKTADPVYRLLEPIVTGLGYELVGVEFDGRPRTLRVYIDSRLGITVDDCSKVSHHLSGVLDVEDPIRGSYQLEVSSPGIDRPLFHLTDFERFQGHQVRIELRSLLNGRRKFKGCVVGIEAGEILVKDGSETVRIPHGMIARARLVPELHSRIRKGRRHGE